MIGTAEAARVLAAHRDYYVGLAEQAHAAFMTNAHAQWLGRLHAEDNNLRAALEWSRDHSDGAHALTRLGAALQEYWEFAGRFSEGRQWLDQALDQRAGVPPAAQQAILIAAARFASYLGDFAKAEALLAESLDLARRHHDAFHEAEATSHLGYVALTRGDLPAAIERHSWGLALWEAIGDTNHIADSITGLGITAVLMGDVTKAIALLERSLPLCRQGTQRFYLADNLLTLGFARFLAGEPLLAFTALVEGLTEARSLEAQALVARGLDEFAFVAGMSGKMERSIRLLAAAETLRARIGMPMVPAYQDIYSQLLAVLHATMSDVDFEACWSAGLMLDTDQAIALALERDEAAG